MATPRRGLLERSLLATMLLAALGAGGCAGAGLAAVGPLWTAVQVVTDRSVERTLAADLPSGWTATVDALTRMGIRPRDAAREGERWVLKGDGDKVSVSAELAALTAGMTRLTVRVEAGRIGADKQTAEELVNQVVASLATRGASREATADRERAAADRNASSEALSALEAEVRRLRTEIEQRQAPKVVPDRPAAPVGRSEAPVAVGGVVTIPSSYGVATVPIAPLPMPTSPPATSRPPAMPMQGVVETAPVSENAARGDDMLAGSLKPVTTLVPVAPVSGRRSSE